MFVQKLVIHPKTCCSGSAHYVFNHFLQEFQEQIKGASFKDVVIRGRELSGALITGLINVYIKDNASVDAISNHLRDLCPLLYSSDDSTCSKVHTHPKCIVYINLSQPY